MITKVTVSQMFLVNGDVFVAVVIAKAPYYLSGTNFGKHFEFVCEIRVE